MDIRLGRAMRPGKAEVPVSNSEFQPAGQDLIQLDQASPTPGYFRADENHHGPGVHVSMHGRRGDGVPVSNEYVLTVAEAHSLACDLRRAAAYARLLIVD